MSTLLYIESSPRKMRSSSIKIAKDFLAEYAKKHPNDDIVTIDLWQKNLSPFDGDIIDAKYAILHGQSHTEAQRKSWRNVEQIINEFKQADKYLFSIPMWNFGIPYVLKHYIDLLVQPSYTFQVTPEGQYKGLVLNKPALLIYSRGGSYGAESNDLDFQKKYMETILGFIGITDIQSIIIEPTLSGDDLKEKSLKEAKQKADTIANHF